MTWLAVTRAILAIAPGGRLASHSAARWNTLRHRGDRHTITLEFAGAKSIDVAAALLAQIRMRGLPIPDGLSLVDVRITRALLEAGHAQSQLTVELELLVLETEENPA